MKSSVRFWSGLSAFVLAALPVGAARAQDAAGGGESADARVSALEAEVAALKARMDKEDGDEGDELSGWQVSLTGSWFTLAHNHRKGVLSGDDHQHGWAAGLGINAPLYPGLGPVDLVGHIGIHYRNLAYSTAYTSAVTSAKGTISYLNVVLAPTIRIPVNESVRPFVRLGVNIQVVSPPTDPITYLDLGVYLSGGLDFAVTPRVSVGFEYSWSWFGVADQEREDFGMLSTYVGFNF